MNRGAKPDARFKRRQKGACRKSDQPDDSQF